MIARRPALGAAAALALAAAWTGPAAAQLAARAVMRPVGQAAGDLYGATVAAAGDLNGDGFADFLVAATRADATFADAGRAYVYLGGTRLDSLPDAVAAGRTPAGLAGTTFAGVGDVNDDGYDDWLLGSPNYDTGAPPRFPGKAWLYFGGAALDAVADRTLDMPSGQSNSALFGTAIARLGDVNADGYPDFLVSAFVVAPDSLSAFVYFGGPNLDAFADLALRTGPGFTVRSAAAGDVNGDGWNDIVVGVSGQSSATPGRLQVFFGGPALDGLPDVTIVSPGLQDSYGFAVACGDLNGDGFADLAVAAMNRSSPGRAFNGEVMVHFGPAPTATPDLVVQGAATSDNLGTALAMGGDLDGDGIADLAIGVPGADGRATNAGQVWILFGGAAPRATPGLKVDGEAANDLFGSSVAFAGDPDLRGSDALLAGAPQNDAAFTNAGRAYLLRIERYAIARPAAGERWEAGGTASVEWGGAEPADLELSLDGGASWATLATAAGGAAANALAVAVPDVTTGRARIRLTRSGAGPGSGESAPSPGEFRIARVIPAPAAILDELTYDPGTSPGRLGSAVAAGVDWDRDGAPDLFAGAPFAADGALAIRSGGVGAGELRAGITAFEQFGAAVANAGDLNGDGFDDLAVGAPSCAAAGPEAGRVYVFFGGPASDGGPDRVIEGRRARELFGAAVAAAGDLNGDGHADLVVGAPGSGGDGRAYVFYGGPAFDAIPDRTLTAGIPGPFGLVVSGAGDVNGDGAGDLLVSGPPVPGGTGSSALHLFLGGAGVKPWDRRVLEGREPGDGFGSALTALGDLDGDGFDDFAVGVPFADAPGAADAGAVEVFFGGVAIHPRPGLRFLGSAPGEFFGSALVGRVDLNGDGRPDLAIGAPGHAGAGPLAGRVDVLFGGSDGAVDVRIEGSEPGARFGSSLAAFGSPSAERFGAIAVGAPFAVAPGAAEGRLHALEAARWRLRTPRVTAAGWLAGAPLTVRWTGAEPADVWFAGPTGGERLAAAAGGAPGNVLELVLPVSLPDSGRIELRPADPALRGLSAGPPVRLRREVRATRFEAEAREDGVALAWATDPAIGPNGLTGYRLWRARGPLPREAVGGDLRGTAALDAEGRAGDAYTLVGVTAAGAEYEVATLALPAAPRGIRAWPQPAGESGRVRIAFEAPRAGGAPAADLEVRVFDARGRRVRTLAFGRPAPRAGVVELEWDGHTDGGARAGPGLYFVRARAPSAGFDVTRRVVMLDTPRR